MATQRWPSLKLNLESIHVHTTKGVKVRADVQTFRCDSGQCQTVEARPYRIIEGGIIVRGHYRPDGQDCHAPKNLVSQTL